MQCLIEKTLHTGHASYKVYVSVTITFGQPADNESTDLSCSRDAIVLTLRLFIMRATEQEKCTFVSYLLPLLSEYSLQPQVPDAQSIVSNVKVLFKHLQENLLLAEDCAFRGFLPRGDCRLVKNMYRRLSHLQLCWSLKKVHLVAALVRGMRVEDALMQLQVTGKRASHTVYRVIHAARANASHNHGLDPDRLLIAEAFVGKGLFKKRISYHGKGKCGLMERPECRLTSHS
ncbi:unnamed protein product [Cochlearia groenlandica]